MSTFDERLNEALQRSGLTRTALAKALGISHSAVTQALSGNTKAFTASNNAAAAKALGVNADWLATGDGHWEVPEGRLGQLSDEEVALIEVMRALPQEVKRQASAAALKVANEYLQRVTTLLSRSGA